MLLQWPSTMTLQILIIGRFIYLIIPRIVSYTVSCCLSLYTAFPLYYGAHHGILSRMLYSNGKYFELIGAKDLRRFIFSMGSRFCGLFIFLCDPKSIDDRYHIKLVVMINKFPCDINFYVIFQGIGIKKT